MELTASEERLVELLAAMGTVDEADLRACAQALVEARGRGEEVDLGALLVERGVASEAMLDSLLGNEEDAPRKRRLKLERPSRQGRVEDSDEFVINLDSPSAMGQVEDLDDELDPERPALASRVIDSDEEPLQLERPSRRRQRSDSERGRSGRGSRRSGRTSGRAEAKSGRAEAKSGRAEAKSGRAEAKSGRAEAKSGRAKSARTTPRGSRSDLGVTPSPDYFDPDEPSSILDEVETRRFDLDALAAASAQPEQRFLMPALLGGAALVLVLGAAGWFATRRDVAQAPPTAPPGSAVNDTPFDDVAPVDSEAEDPDAKALAALEALVDDREARADYRGALKLYADVDPDLRARHPKALAEGESRLKMLERHRLAVEELLSRGSAPGSAEDTAEALMRMQACRDDHPTLAETPAALKLDDAIFALTQRLESLRRDAPSRDERPTPPSDSPRRTPEPPERVQRFEELARRGAERLKGIKAQIAAAQEGQSRFHEEAVRRARSASELAPRDLELMPGYVLEKAVLVDFNSRVVTLRSGENRTTYDWDTIDPQIALTLRKLAVRDDSASEQFLLGRWCLERRLFEEAREAFGRSVILDPVLKGQVPDVSSIARASRIFNGRLQRNGTMISVSYGFSQAIENADWEPARGVKGGVNAKASRFEAKGKGIYLASLKEVGFRERVSIHANVGTTAPGAAAVLAITFGAETAKEVRYLASADRETGLVILAREQGGRVRVLDRQTTPARGARMKLSLEALENRLRVRVGDRTVFKVGIDPDWDRVRVSIGGASNKKGHATLEGVVVRGRVRRSWLRKSFGEFDALLRGLLAQAEDLRVFAEPATAAPPPPAISAADAYGLRDMSPDAHKAFLEGLVGESSRSTMRLLAASTSLGKAIDETPTFAAALYYRALVLKKLGRPQSALSDLEQAIEQCPRFYEALAQRAHLLATQGRLEEARADAEASLVIRPDYSLAFSARALTAFRAGDLEAALTDLDLALALNPWDDEVRSFRRNVSNVVKGPPWERPFSVETEHYIVKTDISSRRCAKYARELEVIRGFYTQQFGEPEGQAKKAVVLIFDTREGFHSYAHLTTDDRVESLLGYYLPRYGQLLLYEDKDDASLEETRRVLYHEAFHQFIEGLIPSIPYWLNEGFADYYSASRVEGQGVAGRGETLPGRLKDLQRFLKRGGPVPFPRLMRETPTEFYSGPVAAKYAQAWSMVHFFLHGASNPVKKRFYTYVKLFLGGSSGQKAFQGAWDGADWKATQRAWETHVQGL